MAEMIRGKSLPELDLSPGQTLKRHDSVDDVGADDWRSGVSPGNGYGALVYGALFNSPRFRQVIGFCASNVEVLAVDPDRIDGLEEYAELEIRAMTTPTKQQFTDAIANFQRLADLIDRPIEPPPRL